MIGERIKLRISALGINQSEAARRAGIGQQTMNSIIRKNPRMTPYLVQIATALKTTPAYLTGATADPEEGAEQQPATLPMKLTSMPVAMPSGPALMRMFQALLLPLPAEASRDEIARRLAETLPTGLARLQADLVRQVQALTDAEEWPAVAAAGEAPARRLGRRT